MSECKCGTSADALKHHKASNLFDHEWTCAACGRNWRGHDSDGTCQG